MIFTETRLKGAFIIELERREDERGFFSRSFCQNPVIAQSGIATGRRAAWWFATSVETRRWR